MMGVEGIRAEDKERLFAPFVPVSDQPTVEAGTGLGLANSKRYADLMRGQLRVNAEPDTGPVFNFDIPLRIRG